jgi:hypothetical protein
VLFIFMVFVQKDSYRGDPYDVKKDVLLSRFHRLKTYKLRLNTICTRNQRFGAAWGKS